MFSFLKSQDINKGVEEAQVKEGSVLVDVRSRDEYRGGHIPGSINVDLAELSKITSLVTDKNTPLFVYCLSGSRSNMAVSMLESMGYDQVKNIGGISSYAGSIEKGA